MNPTASSRPYEMVPFIADGRFCISYAPAAGQVRCCVLHVQAFAEEMNKSRRMVAQTCQALATDGCAVLQVDLTGCGDSSADLTQADWHAWQADVDWGLRWLAERYGNLTRWIWGHRAGALLAAQALATHPGSHLLLWQPVVQGRSIVQTMLRLKAAAQWAQIDGKTAIAQARAELDAGRVLDVAGYPLTSALTRDLESAVMTPATATSPGSRLVWMEVSSRADAPGPSPVAKAQCEAWRAAGWQVDLQMVQGPMFWQTVELEDAPALIVATRAALAATASASAILS